MKIIYVINLILFFNSCASYKSSQYPSHWWKFIDKKDLKWWEIAPHSAKKGEVILSKRNELGILSNFADTPFVFHGKKYPTVEALWQSMKYPENRTDMRFQFQDWHHTREEVEQMSGFSAKKAGDLGTLAMKKLKINWVSFQGEKLVYRTPDKDSHYKIIRKAMLEKLRQNPKVRRILLATRELVLMPDHKANKTDPPAWKYYKIWMEIRESLLK
jgi:predicted NAD-dependent protein-ADP-ribosyltransferase YbiA (DUF1768 family)